MGTQEAGLEKLKLAYANAALKLRLTDDREQWTGQRNALIREGDAAMEAMLAAAKATRAHSAAELQAMKLEFADATIVYYLSHEISVGDRDAAARVAAARDAAARVNAAQGAMLSAARAIAAAEGGAK